MVKHLNNSSIASYEKQFCLLEKFNILKEKFKPEQISMYIIMENTLQT